MRYYLVTVQFNKEKKEENRTVPKAFNTRDEAIAEFHKQMGNDMKNATLGWALNIIFDSNGGIVKEEKWVEEVQPTVEPTEE